MSQKIKKFNKNNFLFILSRYTSFKVYIGKGVAEKKYKCKFRLHKNSILQDVVTLPAPVQITPELPTATTFFSGI